MLASGRDDTALINAIVNDNILVAAYVNTFMALESMTLAQAKAYTKSATPLALLGDDPLFIVPKPTNPDLFEATSRSFAALAGFILEGQWLGVVFDIVSLGQRPYPVIHDGRKLWKWGPTLGRRLPRHH
jgi:hypothetical protein